LREILNSSNIKGAQWCISKHSGMTTDTLEVALTVRIERWPKLNVQ